MEFLPWLYFQFFFAVFDFKLKTPTKIEVSKKTISQYFCEFFWMEASSCHDLKRRQ